MIDSERDANRPATSNAERKVDRGTLVWPVAAWVGSLGFCIGLAAQG